MAGANAAAQAQSENNPAPIVSRGQRGRSCMELPGRIITHLGDGGTVNGEQREPTLEEVMTLWGASITGTSRPYYWGVTLHEILLPKAWRISEARQRLTSPVGCEDWILDQHGRLRGVYFYQAADDIPATFTPLRRFGIEQRKKEKHPDRQWQAFDYAETTGNRKGRTIPAVVARGNSLEIVEQLLDNQNPQWRDFFRYPWEPVDTE